MIILLLKISHIIHVFNDDNVLLRHIRGIGIKEQHHQITKCFKLEIQSCHVMSEMYFNTHYYF